MTRLALTLALATLSACAAGQPARPAPAPVQSQPQQKAPAARVAPEAPQAPSRLPFASVYFDFDRSNIRSDQQATLVDHAARLEAERGFRLSLEGHADERGTVEYNLALGQKRADAAKAFLVRNGVPAHRLNTVSYGEERPAAKGHDEAAWARNRRVDAVRQ